MVIHGIYLKSRPKGKWHLVSVAVSAEVAEREIDQNLKHAQNQGNDQAQCGAQVFESAFHIPELLSELKLQKVLYN